MSSRLVICPICSREVPENNINPHIDNNCSDAGTSTQKKVKDSSNNPQSVSFASIFSQSQGKSKSQSQAQAIARESPFASNSSPSSSSNLRKRKSISESTASYSQKRFRGADKVAIAPLAERLRPQSLEDFVGQPHLTGPDSILIPFLQRGSTGSMILWGPPGSGKTTLARLMAKRSDAAFKELSATDSNVADVRAVAEEAKGLLSLTKRRTILFLDEVHRFNKAQQDIFLPYIEQGIIQLIGATTENPSFKLTSALLSRCRVFVLERLTDDDLRTIIAQAIKRASVSAEESKVEVGGAEDSYEPPSPTPHASGQTFESSQSSNSTAVEVVSTHIPQCTPEIISSIVSLSVGDARTALSLLELVLSSPKDIDPTKLLTSLRQSVSTSYDRTGDDRYDMISALHKSVRGSQANAAMYWLARMLSTGEDPMYVARRMTVCASEDIGLADPHALPLAIAAMQACQFIGMPECRINLAHLVAYLCEAPKSTRAYEAYKRAEAAAQQNLSLPVPLMVRNAPTRLMDELGYSKGYRYNPDFIHPVTNDYLPLQLQDEVFLYPAGDITGKVWDDISLRDWEVKDNADQEWEGRSRYTQFSPDSKN